MKRLKRYTFILLMFISSICYGMGKLVLRHGEESRHQLSVKETSKESYKEQGMSNSSELQMVLKRMELQKEQPPTKEIQEKQAQSEGQQSKAEQNNVVSQKRVFHRVEMDYLDDALFIGDSRTSTLYEYANWEHTDFIPLTVYIYR